MIHKQRYQPLTCKCSVIEVFDLSIQGEQTPSIEVIESVCEKHNYLTDKDEIYSEIRKESMFLDNNLNNVKIEYPDNKISWSFNSDNDVLVITVRDQDGTTIKNLTFRM